jgi:hypothetical protein
VSDAIKAAVIDVRGLKCDAPGCGYEQDWPSTKRSGMHGYRAWVNAPCPRCGANLLTEEDMRAVERLELIARVTNIIMWPLGLLGFHKKKYTYKLGMDGSGKVTPEKVSEEALD